MSAPTGIEESSQQRATEAALFNPSAEVYEEALVPVIFEPWGRRLVDLAGPRTGERVLDLACGTGIVARTAAARVGPGGTVVGLDLNPAMLAVARRSSDWVGLEIDWQEGDAATTLPFADDAFDVVLCQQGLQFFTDREHALEEVHRVTAPRGRAAFAVWRGLDHHRIYELFDEVLAGHLPAETVAGSDAPFSLGNEDELRRLVRGAGYADVQVRLEIGTVRFNSVENMLLAIGGAHAPVAAAVDALGEELRRDLVVDLSRSLRSYTDDDGVAYPMVSSVVLARP